MSQVSYESHDYQNQNGSYTPASPVPSYSSRPTSPNGSAGYLSPPMSPISVDSSQFSGYSYSASGGDPAQMKALELLGKQAYAEPERPSRVSSREAAHAHYHNLKTEKMRRKEHLKSPLLKKRQTKLAETTRKVKVVEDEEGIETVHEMKCQLELDRENEAKKTALRLLELGFM